MPDGREVSYSYDANGNLTSLVPPSRPAHEFGYTSRNQEESYTPPDVGGEAERATTYEYNLDKQPVSATRPDSGKIEYSYDAAGRASKVTHPDGEMTYAYDQGTGNVKSVSSPGGTFTYSYDGSLPLEEKLTGEVSGSVKRTYGEGFRVKEVSVNGGKPVPYSMDDDGLLTAAGELSISRDPKNGRLTGTTLSETTDSVSQGGFGELTGYEASAAGTRKFETSYGRDSSGRISEKTETVEGETSVYSYTYDDESGRLVEVKKDGQTTARYSYDENGNRLSHEDESGRKTEGAYDDQDRLLSYGSNEYSYTGNGELTSKTDVSTDETTSYDYDRLATSSRRRSPTARR